MRLHKWVCLCVHVSDHVTVASALICAVIVIGLHALRHHAACDLRNNQIVER